MVADENPTVGMRSLGHSWRRLAACRGVGPAPFFDELPRDALACCARCPVQEICLWYALAEEEKVGYRFGLWAGTTPTGRARIARVTGPGYARGRLATALVASVELASVVA
jgi:hypothetical protein